MKAVHLTTVHRATDTRILYRECRTLSRAGYNVVLIAPCVNNREIEGVRLSCVGQPHNRWQRLSRTCFDVLKAALHERAEIYHFHDPELILVGLILLSFGYRVIYDVHEDVPKDILSKYYLPVLIRRPTARLVAFVEWIAARAMSGIIAATPAIAQRFPDAKTVVVQNFPLPDELWKTDRAAYRDRPNTIAYVGNITEVRGARQMVEAVALVPRSVNLRLSLAGDFSPPDLQHEVSRLSGFDRVDALGWQNREQVAALLGKVRAGLLLTQPIPRVYDTQPLKLFEYMSAGIPVVASNFRRWRDIVSSSGCGLLVDPSDPEAIADAIVWILEHPEEAEKMGDRGREAILNSYNWASEARRLTAAYRTVIENP